MREIYLPSFTEIFPKVFLAVLLSCFALVALGQDPTDQRATARLQAGDTLGAIAVLKKELTSVRKPADVANAEGFIKYLQHDDAGALEDFDRAIDLNADHAVAYHNRALVEGRLAMDSEAAGDYAAAIRIDPYFLAAYWSRGLAKAGTGNYAEAVRDFSSVLAMKPDWTAALYQRALAYGRLKEYKRQVSDLDQIVRLTPHDVKVYLARGMAKARQGRYDEAVDDYDLALGLEPENHDARFHKNAAEEKAFGRRAGTEALTSTKE
ncbi:MAG: tetratricopeptide repeat protein [Ferruginibacter sp.]|nr:tetratricopeptide repeat protein [Cytophagales bacterium]